MRKITLLLTILILLTTLAIAKDRDIVYLTDGSEYVGGLVRITDDQVVLQTDEGEVSFPTDSVRSIDLGTWRPGDGWENRLDIDDPILKNALETADRASREYTTAGYITIYEKATLTVNEDMSADYVVRYIHYIANERGKNKANFSMAYYDDVQSVTVDFARSVGLASISTVADNAIEDGSTNAWLPEYQRRRIKKFALTGASLGSVIDYQLTKHYDRFDQWNSLFERWTFYGTEPILSSAFEVKYHKSIPLEFHEVELPKPEKSSDGDYEIREWKMTDIDPYIEETMLPSLNWFMPNVAVTLPQNMEQLSAAYYNKIDNAMDAMEKIESRLMSQFPNGDPTIEEVYNFVSQNFASNGISLREYYPYPKPLSELLEMPRVASYELDFILFSFLKAAGHNPQLVLVGPGLDSKIPDDMFNLSFFNSIVVKVDDNGKTRYISPNEFLRYDHQHMSGQYILPVSEKGSKLEKIDMLPGDHHYSIPKYTCVLRPNGTLDAEYNVEYVGETGGDHYRHLKNRKPREVDNYFDSIAKTIDELAHIVDYQLEGFKNLADKVDVSYSVEVPGFAVSAGEEIMAFRLPTVDFSAYQVGAAERTLPFSRPGNFYSEKHITIELPEGYEIEYLPESIDISTGYRSFEGEIVLDGNTLTYRQIVEGEHEPMLPPEEYPEYKEFEEARAKFGDSWILLRKSS